MECYYFKKGFLVEHIYEYLIGGRKMGGDKGTQATDFMGTKKGFTLYVYTFDKNWNLMGKSAGEVTGREVYQYAIQFTAELDEPIIDSSMPNSLIITIDDGLFHKDIYVLKQYARKYKHLIVSTHKLSIQNAKETKRIYGGIEE